MKYGTLFSGIEGFGCGFDRAGMTCAFQVEIDPQCLQVLRYHYPDVPKWTDVTEVDPSELPDVDVLAFGSPCQDLSVAGRREGLAGERSGLFIEAIRIADRLAPDWLVFENVPGLFSSNGGEDFAVCLEGFTGFRPAVPDEGWESAGFCHGPLRTAFWRVCDTQFWGPPQRRRRVFVVAGPRAARFPEVLLEPESLPWDPPPSRETGQGASPLLEVGARTSGDGYRDGDGIGQPGDPMYTLQARHQHGVTPFDTTQITSRTNRSRPKPGDPCHPIAAGAHPHAVAGVPDPAYAVTGGPTGNQFGTGRDAQDTFAIAHTLRAEGHDASEDGTGRGVPLVAHETGQGWWKEDESAGTLRAEGENRPSRPSHVVGATAPRRLTPKEAERLQGFPDGWTAHGRTPDSEIIELADSPRYRMLGNAVSVPVAEWIGRRIMESLP